MYEKMRSQDNNDKWHWLEPVKKNGVPWQALMNRVGSDAYLMSFICESIVFAVRELDTRSKTLQAFSAFFCTSVIGAIVSAKIHESHSTTFMQPFERIVRELDSKSNSIDFRAASLMIIGQLENKVKLDRDILDVSKPERNCFKGNNF